MALNKAAIVRCLRGAFVADIASMGTHWIYDPKQMAASVPSVETPEFKNPPTPQFYSATEYPGHYGPGMLSPYGEQLLWVVEHLVQSKGAVDGVAMLDSMVSWADGYTGRPDSALKAVVEAVKDHKKGFPEAGADDDQAHCFLKAIPVTCLYAGKPELRQRVEEAIRVHQNNDTAVAFGVAVALLLEYILLHGKIPIDLDSIEDLPDQVKQAWSRATATSEDLESLLLTISHELMAGKEDSPFYDLAGRSCKLPGSFIAPAYLLQRIETDEAYVKALRQNILGAGDTCSRAVLLGGILGALGSGPPASWTEQVDKETMDRIDLLADKLADIATGGKDEL